MISVSGVSKIYANGVSEFCALKDKEQYWGRGWQLENNE